MKTVEQLGLKTPWQLFPYGPSTKSTVATHGDIETADGRSFFPNGEFPEIQDARMMKAAPKLYEHLRVAVIDKCRQCPNCNTRDGYACVMLVDKCYVKKWRAALAEAAGEDSSK